jgi:N-acylneuraminate cytidylyltransferase
MWAWDGAGYPMTPLLSYQRSDGTPWHSSPTQTLPTFYMQNASLEMCWAYVARDLHSITGKKVVPFLTEGYEGFDLNTDRDWHEAERLVTEGLVSLPALDVAALREAAGAL